jgi:hypothetical protein
MRYRLNEPCIYHPGGQDDLFTDTKRVLFKHYVGGQSAKIYVGDGDYKNVPLTHLQHGEQVAV